MATVNPAHTREAVARFLDFLSVNQGEENAALSDDALCCYLESLDLAPGAAVELVECLEGWRHDEIAGASFGFLVGLSARQLAEDG